MIRLPEKKKAPQITRPSDLRLERESLRKISRYNKKKSKRIVRKEDNLPYSGTHYFITLRAMEYLRNSGGPELLPTAATRVCACAVYPDHVFNAWRYLYAHHFYHKGMNFVEEHFYIQGRPKQHLSFGEFLEELADRLVGFDNEVTNSHNALTCFIKYISRALVYARQGQDSLYHDYLGYALHFLQDLCAPHHAVNAPAVLTNHAEYELWVNGVVNDTRLCNLLDINAHREDAERMFDFSIQGLGLYHYLLHIHSLASRQAAEIMEGEPTGEPDITQWPWFAPSYINMLLAQKATADVISYVHKLAQKEHDAWWEDYKVCRDEKRKRKRAQVEEEIRKEIGAHPELDARIPVAELFDL